MKRTKWLMLLVVFAMIIAACSSDSDDETTTFTASADTETTTTAASGDDTTDTTAASGDDMVDVSGTEVSVFAAPTGDEGASIQGMYDVYNGQTGGVVTGVRARDLLNGTELEIEARVVVNATDCSTRL